MKRLFALAACALSCLSAHATLGFVSYGVNVSPTFGTVSPTAAQWAKLPLFNTSEFIGARLYEVTIEVTSTIEVTGSVTNSGRYTPPGQRTFITMNAGETINWLFKPPQQSVASGLAGLTQQDGVTETFSLKSAADGPDSQRFDLFDTKTSSYTWLDSAPHFDAFTTDGHAPTTPTTMVDYFLTACETGRTGFTGTLDVHFGAPKCSAHVTYNYVPEPGGVALASVALLAGGWVRRRRDA